MRLNDLVAPGGANKNSKRVGRGSGSGHGKTSCRGHKGQMARSGRKTRPGFEGGQMPLSRRVPKRGFNNRFKTTYQIVNLEKLSRFRKDSTVTAQMLREHGLIKNTRLPVKILGTGKISKALNIQAHSISKQAREKIEKAAGKVELQKEAQSRE